MNTNREKAIEQLEFEINLIKSKFDKLFNELSELETEGINHSIERLKELGNILDATVVGLGIHRTF